jgi:tetratricopeptide (TPR) repeat protein
MTEWLSTSRLRISFILCLLASGSGLWWYLTKRDGSYKAPHSQTHQVGTISLAERRLRTAERQLQLRPKDPAAYAEMAAAYMEKARETGDGAFYGRAESACQKALQLEPKNYAALRLVSWVYSGQHRFREAVVAARLALDRDSGDPLNYGTLGDALLELGEYQEGAQAIQKMVDLRPDVASYARAAYVRELFGDMEGAIEIMGMAVRAASSRDVEHNAWCRVQLANLLFNAGRLADAEAQYQAALQIFPNYHFAFTGLGRVRTAQQHFDEAISYFQKSVDLVPTYEAVFGLADLYSHLKRPAETSRQFELLETLEKISQANRVQPEAQLAMFYADHGIRLTEALNIARQQASERRDIKTLDALAWVLFKNGKTQEALRATQQALRLGTKDPMMHYHHGMIARELGQYREATESLQQALAANPYFHPHHAEEARMALQPLLAARSGLRRPSRAIN